MVERGKLASLVGQTMPQATSKSIEKYVGPLQAAMRDQGITDPNDQAMFLANIAGETAQLNLLSEGGSYNDPKEVRRYFSSTFKTPEETLPYLRNSEKMLNHVYANQPGNGPEGNGNGYRYRGRGLLQITGKNNY